MQGLITLATPLLQTSLVASGTCVPGRTSSSMFLHGAHEQEPCVVEFDRKVHHLLQTPAMQADNLSVTEALQISQYKEGQFYDAHFDNKSEECWRRAATLISYLKSRREDGSEDPASLHAAEKVIRGQKWICSRWFKAPSSCLAGGDDNPRAPEP
ncbi:g331 [Coccomyxa elongata]